MQPFVLEVDKASIGDVAQVARAARPVRVGERARIQMQKARDFVDRLLQERAVVYGVTTGFGRFAEVLISREDAHSLQQNLIRSHAVAVGEPLCDEVVRAAVFLRVLALARGHSGVRPEVADLLVGMLNENVVPVIPQQGSLGASGDLSPLAHMALVLMGEGRASHDGELLPGGEALRRAGLSPLRLEAKEGLALINGTQVATALGVLAAVDAEVLCRSADAVASLSLEALRGIRDAFEERIARLRPHPGHAASADAVRSITEGSTLLTRQGQVRVQDAYSLRCIPQVHGAVRDAIDYAKSTLSRELAAVTDNPLLFPDDEEVLSGGNFHAEPVAFALDHLALALADLGNISERRTERLLNPAHNEGLPAFLTAEGGLNSGLMIAQYTAASLTAENRLLAVPASADSVSTSAGQEDHVSMATTAARRARDSARNLSRVLAVELVAAAQAADLRLASQPRLRMGRGTAMVHAWLRGRVAHLDADRVLSEQLQQTGDALKRAELLDHLADGACSI